MEHQKQKPFGRSRGIASDLLEQIIKQNWNKNDLNSRLYKNLWQPRLKNK